MFFRKTKLNELQRELDELQKELSFYKKRDVQQRRSNIRCKGYPHILLKDNDNYIIIDLLDDIQTTAIYIYKLDRPAEQWMFDLGFELRSESFAEFIGELEFGSITEGKAEIKRLSVNEEYRNQGFATYMMKKVIAWGRYQDFSELNLTACTSVYKLGNALNQAELVSFYCKLGFENISPKSNRMTYKYYDAGAKT
ncbi:GNAT family N-acetyltransferase [Bacillus thuringiensis]|uniref:GNAT family N-acetyltransferase n=1 Tax=Bacillus thuringiensis serovar andalousiensis TaxID=257985 RepID=A0A6H0TNW0_BACTU|nr:GNAT family N-acetyltransferase [Bacillus thuringiensis]QIW21344.1 GNAT family N-acetyltransferase [Bacillus thuringiensis serovar andalousiensis]